MAEPERLSRPARDAIASAEAESDLGASSISVWEIALLAERGRLELALPVEDWLAHLEALPGLAFLPVDNRIALRSVHLPAPLHPDPADRILVATALVHGARLVTRDQRLREYPAVETIW